MKALTQVERRRIHKLKMGSGSIERLLDSGSDVCGDHPYSHLAPRPLTGSRVEVTVYDELTSERGPDCDTVSDDRDPRHLRDGGAEQYDPNPVSRESGRTLLETERRRFLDLANQYSVLLRVIPEGLSDEADEALWNLMCAARCR
jgi:hypothetical protein